MADKHPYITSAGGLIQVINHLRSSFPASLTADTLKKLGYAPKNETYIISTLRFVGLIDKDGAKTEAAGKIFSLHQDKDFQKAFGQLVTTAYKELFTLHGEKTWVLDSSQLITFFRQNHWGNLVRNLCWRSPGEGQKGKPCSSCPSDGRGGERSIFSERLWGR